MARRTRLHRLDVSPLARLVGSFVIGAAVTAAFTWRSWVAAALGGWAVACVVFVVLVWAAVGGMSAETTAAHATREEPTRSGAHVVVLVGSLVSLAGVVSLLGIAHGKRLETVAVLAAVAGSWAAVHTVFALRYARMYYTAPVGGIDFHQDEEPRYTDFAYVAFTVGATFAIADTDLASSRLRRTALWHSLVSYLLGAVVIGLTVNLVAGLSG